MKSKERIEPEFRRQLAQIHFKGFEVCNVFHALNHTALSQSLQFMAQNYRRQIRLGDIVMASGMSRRGFTKAFSRHVGRTPGSVLRQARIEFAKRLLMEQDLPLKTIAAITGFRSENTFCIAFHRSTGMAPKKFQRQIWLSAYRTAGARQVSDLNQPPSRLKPARC
jgi:transcriptional regulator GlxA family with amidase domain